MEEKKLDKWLRQLTLSVNLLVIGILGSTLLLLGHALGIFPLESQEIPRMDRSENSASKISSTGVWQAPQLASLPSNQEGDLIRYGHELIAHTAVYLGPKGKVRQISNGMNCQNCHLKGGTVAYGNNYGAVASKYPVFRNRSGTTEGYEKRVNDCIERSLNGKPLDPDSREMKAMVAYMKWLGKDVTNVASDKGFGLLDLPLLEEPADPVKGKAVYEAYCTRCHGEDGKGILAENGLEYTYPPLFGENSYNTGAGLYRLSRFAAFVKANMPYGVTFDNPFLTDEEAWNVAAYVNSMPRPEKDLSMDWPDLSKKPFDHPFGPYTDSFPEIQHKYGPFGPLLSANK
ncbi:c-type cytochrome [Cyclobacterium salsum]|uniref:c-type cytochrome n=1 Tax=Cyclobacterium salsum TaxID=2666329 RepID=UPI001390916D|nr:c-type cytochrome [Cyclobacterium salsum]